MVVADADQRKETSQVAAVTGTALLAGALIGWAGLIFYDVAWETAMIAPKSELAHYPWKDPKELIPIAVRQVRSFLRAHRGGGAALA